MSSLDSIVHLDECQNAVKADDKQHLGFFGIMDEQLTVKAGKSSSALHYCLDRSLIRKYRNLYWVETLGKQVRLQEVKYPLS